MIQICMICRIYGIADDTMMVLLEYWTIGQQQHIIMHLHIAPLKAVILSHVFYFCRAYPIGSRRG